MDILIGSARIDEHGHAVGGARGDQKQKGTMDFSGEVSIQSFYMHSKGWNILRAKDPEHAIKISNAMIYACNNAHIGYNQAERLDIIKSGIRTTKDVNCDCSSLVRECVREATGKDPGNFNTATEKAALLNTGLFDCIPCKSSESLRIGDILVTKTKGHTAVVVKAPERSEIASNKNVAELDKAIEVVAKYVLRGAFGNGSSRKENLYITVQRKVNELSRR